MKTWYKYDGLSVADLAFRSATVTPVSECVANPVVEIANLT